MSAVFFVHSWNKDLGLWLTFHEKSSLKSLLIKSEAKFVLDIVVISLFNPLRAC